MAKKNAAAVEPEADEEAGIKVADGEEIPGVDPDTGELVSVSVETLQKKFGLSRKEAIEAYDEIAVAGLFCGRGEFGELRTGLAIGGASGKEREAIDAILSKLG